MRSAGAARTGSRSAPSVLRRSALTGHPAPLAGRHPGRRTAWAHRAVMAALTASVVNAAVASLWLPVG